MKKYVRKVLALVVVVATIAAFSYYISHHPETVRQLRHLAPAFVLLLLLMSSLAFIAYAVVTRISLKVYQRYVSVQENILLNAYSSLINFFGPGQSGPAFRAVYLKKRHNLGIKQYAYVTLIYYAFFAVISVFFVLAGTRPWWQTVLALTATAGACWAFIRRKQRKIDTSGAKLTIGNFTWLAGATIAQLVILMLMYGLELHLVDKHVSFSQMMTYAGVANLSLFVSFTPGGIGIRESFLLLSQQLHHIDSSTVVAASVIDRAVYLVFLGILCVIVLALHAKKKLQVTKGIEEGTTHETKG